MSGIQGSSFRVVFLAATLSTLLATSSFSADILTLRKQAEAGDAQAQYNLGVSYSKGLDVSQDYAEAAKWLQKAAEQGLTNAQYNLGIAYANGLGVPKDDVQSYFWLSLAASGSIGEDRKDFSDTRDQAAKKLTHEKLMEAQRMRKEWEAKHSRK